MSPNLPIESVEPKSPEPVMVTLKDTMAQLDWLSDRISTQVRWFAAAVIGLVWGLLLTPPSTVHFLPSALTSVGMLAVTILFFDFLQYSCGYIATQRQHRRLLELPGQQAEGYDAQDPWYRARTDFFWVKQGFAVLTFFALLAAFIPGLVQR